MKVLMVHNYYGSAAPSGENEVFEAEINLLRQHGNKVYEFTRHSDEIRSKGHWGTLKGAISTPWNQFSCNAMRKAVIERGPDVVHVHNTFPLLSPSVFYSIEKPVARVLTLHNYRLFCPAGIPMRKGTVCTKCLDTRSSWPSIKYGCYRNSRVATLPIALSISLHRMLRTWVNKVDAFIALSEFQQELMVKSGLPEKKVYVKPNFYPGTPPVKPWQDRKPYVVFVGRLSKEKGVVTLLQAWRKWGTKAPELRLVGDGGLRSELERLARNLPVRFLGQVTSSEAQEQIACSRLLILPSEWFEGFPMVIREAFALGTPAAVSSIGPLPAIVKNGKSGIVFNPSDSDSLRYVVERAWQNPEMLERLGKRARIEYEENYNDKTNYKILSDIYRKALSFSKTKISK